VTENQNPYDTLFRAAFGDTKTAKELTLLLLPSAPARRLAGARVTVEPDSLVDQEGRTHRTDLLLEFRRSPMAGPAYVYVLYEHKSSPDRWVTLQLLRYLVALWTRLAGEPTRHDNGLLPEILPVVLYHGDRLWSAPLRFTELITGGERSPYIPRFKPLFINLTEIPDSSITGSLRAVLGLLALKYARLQMAQHVVDLLTDLLHRGEADPAVRQLVRIVEQVYVAVKSEAEVRRLVAAATRKGYHEVEVGYMTYGQQLLKQGREEGREEGLEQGALRRSRDVLARQLSRKFGLTDAERERIMACEVQNALDAALDEIVDADSKATVLSKLP
jgi:predicted transposase/invertase (TIGR01784 family)